MSSKFVSLVTFALFLFVFGLHDLWALAPGYPTTRQTIHPTFQPLGDKVKIAFFDADSTLRVAPSGAPSANGIDDVAMLPMLAEPMRKLASEGYLLAVVSNQGGVEFGHITLEIAERGLVTIIRKLFEEGVTVHYFDFSEVKGEDRKPDIGMAKRLAAKIKEALQKDVDWPNCIMVGDSGWKKGQDTEPDGTPGEDHSNSDRLFAENLSKAFQCEVKFFHPRDFFGWVKSGIRNFSTYKDLEAFQRKNDKPDQPDPN